MELKWHLPEGWKAGEPQYPVPRELSIGGLMNHVYEADYAVLVPLSAPANVAGPTPVALDASWLACTREVCVPEKATLTAIVPASGAPDRRFDKWLAAIPSLLDQRARFELTPGKLRLAIPLPASLALHNPHVFIEQQQLIDYAAPQTFHRDGNTLVAEIARKGLAKSADSVGGILKIDDKGQGVRFIAAPGPVPSGGEPIAAAGASLAPLWLLLGLACSAGWCST